MNTVLFATTNKHKEKIFARSWEFCKFPKTIQYHTLEKTNIDIEVEENTGSFEGDALKKAIAYGEASGLVTISQDRGFVFDAFDWPGTLTKETMFGSSKYSVGDDGYPIIGPDEASKSLANSSARDKDILALIEGKSRLMTVINATAVYLPNGLSFTAINKTHGVASLESHEGLEGSFSRFFIPEGFAEPLSVAFRSDYELLDYWSKILAPIPLEIRKKIVEFLN